MDYSSDILQPITEENLEKIQLILKERLPKTIRAHHYLFNSRRWTNALNAEDFKSKITSDKCRVKFFGHRSGLITNCTFFGISGEQDYSIFAFTLEDNCVEFRECLLQTKRIKWELAPCIVSMEDQHLLILRDVYPKLPVCFTRPNNIFYLSKEIASNLDIKIPKDVFIKPLCETEAKFIDDQWLRRYFGSYEFISMLLKTNGGLGLYSKETNQLLSWAIINDNFCIGFLGTISSAKRKGYGELLVKALSKKISDDYSLDVLAFVNKENIPSTLLFKKLGFQIANSCAWLIMEKNNFLNSI